MCRSAKAGRHIGKCNRKADMLPAIITIVIIRADRVEFWDYTPRGQPFKITRIFKVKG